MKWLKFEEAADGSPKLRQGVAKDRRISIEDEDMRHGRKSRSQKFDGFKRHIDQARYLGLRKNLFDLRRMAVVHNLHVLARMFHITPENSSLIPAS